MVGIAYLESPVGWLRIKTDDEGIREVEYVDAPGDDSVFSSIGSQAVRELREYFSGERHSFSVPVVPAGTIFQQSVWQLLQQIPFGRSVSYLSLAQKLGNPGALRAVGQANHVNPVAIIVPCHRVVGSDRSLVGYGGGLWRKRWLLEHEQQTKEGTRTVPLTQFF